MGRVVVLFTGKAISGRIRAEDAVIRPPRQRERMKYIGRKEEGLVTRGLDPSQR